MKLSSRDTLRGKVVVITGASSGIGRKAALEFARRGSKLVLAARRGEALEETARMCVGVETLCVAMDVTIEADTKRLVESAVQRFGGIDVFVNNAGVTLFAKIDQASFEEHRRVIETNLFGPMLCTRAVLPIFRDQKHGVMINVNSVLGEVANPFVPSYVISKFGLRGLTEALSVDVADNDEIRICSVFPYAVDTPHFEVAANYLGHAPQAMPPVQDAGAVARAILSLAARPRRARHVPRYIVLGLALHALAPTLVERVLLHALTRWHFSPARQAKTQGSLYEPKAGRARVAGYRRPQVSLLTMTAWILSRFSRIMTTPAPPVAAEPRLAAE